MKKLLVVLMVLSMATIANAGLVIGVGQQVDPPDSTVILAPSETAMISIVSTEPAQLADGPSFLYISGPGVLDISGAVNLFNGSALEIWTDFPMPGDQVFMDTASPVPGTLLPIGAVVDGIIFHCEGLGDVTLSLYIDRSANVGGIFELMDTQVIHQIPEPMTMALLGLGGLFLRRRK